MRPITVEGVRPDLNASIAAAMSAGLRPVSRGTVVSTRLAGWQPEQDVAPGGASASPAAQAFSTSAKPSAAANRAGMTFMAGPPKSLRSPYALLRSWFLIGSERMRLPVAAKIALHNAGASGGTGVSPTPPQKPP